MNRNLVIVCCGKDPAIARWFDPSAPRTWDVIAQVWHTDPIANTRDGVDGYDWAVETVRNPKSQWNAAYDILRDRSGFDQVMLLPDDVEARHEDIDKLFATAQEYGLMVCQPALSYDSYAGWFGLYQIPGVKLRYTNFVESMCPIFSRDGLTKLLPTFQENVSGYGLDMIWHKVLGEPQDKMAVIDSIPVKHMKPIDRKNGSLYKFLEAQGIDPFKERDAVLKKYGVEWQGMKNFEVL